MREQTIGWCQEAVYKGESKCTHPPARKCGLPLNCLRISLRSHLGRTITELLFGLHPLLLQLPCLLGPLSLGLGCSLGHPGAAQGPQCVSCRFELIRLHACKLQSRRWMPCDAYVYTPDHVRAVRAHHMQCNA